MTNQELEDLLQLLLDNSVAEFEGLDIKVRFNPAAPHQSEHGGVIADPDRAKRAATEDNQWKHPALWGHRGSPPSFPKDK